MLISNFLLHPCAITRPFRIRQVVKGLSRTKIDQFRIWNLRKIDDFRFLKTLSKINKYISFSTCRWKKNFIIFWGKNTIFSSLKNISRLNIGATASNKGSYHTVFIAYHPSFYRFELSPIVFAGTIFKHDLGQNFGFRPFEGPETLISGRNFFSIFFMLS